MLREVRRQKEGHVTKKADEYLSKREQQIMDVVYRRGKATVADVCEDIEDIPNYTAARVLMHLLEEKGMLRHERKGQRYVYHPTISAEQVRRSELRHLMQTFFSGSPKEVMADLLDMSNKDIGEEEWDDVYSMIQKAKDEGR